MKDIQQLIKKNSQEGRYEDIFPKTFIDAVLDKESGVTLTDILAMFNMLFLSYNGSRSQTRLQVPSSLRRQGLWVTYVLYDKTVVTEWYSAEAIDDTTFGDSANWRDGSNALVGDISISSDGYWVINGEVTNIKAQGEAGITPILRVGSNNHLQVSYTNGSTYVDVSPNPVFTQFRVSNNKLQQSTDLGESWSNISEELAYKFRESGNKIQMSKDLGNTWEDVSDYIAAWFRFTGTTGSSQADNVGKIQISRDNGATWSDLSGEFTNSLHIKGYVATVGALPSTAVQGDIYGVGPTYDPSDTEHTNPTYQLYVKDSTGWVNNGRFTSIAAGVVQELGNSESAVISQKTITSEFDRVFNPYQIDGEFLAYSDGRIAYDSNYVRSDFLPISKNQPIECYASYGSGSTSLAFYDKNKQFISAIPTIVGKNFKLVVVEVSNIPENAVFICSAIRKDSPYKYLRGFDLNSVYTHVNNVINDVKQTIHNPILNLNNIIENKYWTLSEAIVSIPEEYKIEGLTIIFKSNQFDWDTYTFIGNIQSHWNREGFWIKKPEQQDIDKNINNLYKDGGNRFNYETSVKDFYVNYPSGQLVPALDSDKGNWYASDYIEVIPNTNIMANVVLYDRAFYDNNFKVVQSFTGRLEANTSISVPENASYFRFSTYKINIKTVCLKEQNSGTVTFEKYSRNYKWLPFSNRKLESVISNFSSVITYDNLQVKLPVTDYTSRGSSDINGFGATFRKVAGLEFNAIRMPAGTSTQAPVGKIPKYIKVIIKQSYSDSEFIAVSPMIEITSFPLKDLIFPLQDPITGNSKTLQESDFIGDTYWINIAYYTNYEEAIGYAGVSIANPVISNYVENSSKYNSSEDVTYWREWYSTPCPAFEHLLLDNPKIEYTLDTHNRDNRDTIHISLPDTISAVVGDTLQLFIRGIIRAVNPYNYDVVFSCSKGKMYPRYFEFTPNSQDIGVVPLNIKVKDSNGVLLSQKDCNIIVKAAIKAPTLKKNILCIGDSLTDDRIWSKEMFRHLVQTGGTPSGLGYSNIEFVGRKKFISEGTTQGVEGNRGWSWRDYLTVGRKAFTFAITAPTIMPSVESVYKDSNGKTYTMWWDYTTTSVKMLVDDMVSTPPSSGVLTKVSGNGDSILNYSTVVESSGNPFWDDSTNSLNIKNYVDKWCGGQIDVVYVLLTWNAQTGNRTDFSTFTNYAKVLFTHIKSLYPNISIRLMGIQVPDLRQGERVDGSPMENTYTDQYGLVCTCLNMNEAYQKLANEDDYSSYVKFVNVSSQVDSEYNMPYTQKPVNNRNALMEDVGTNDIHPSDSGYLQIGDVGYRDFVVNFCQ
jgi:hypothetical protein